jgi:hypothetical protein
MRVHLTNFDQYLAGTFTSLAEARAAGEAAGHEFSVIAADGRVLGFWGPLSGWTGL